MTFARVIVNDQILPERFGNERAAISIEGEPALGYEDLRRQRDEYASRLLAWGVAPGDRVGLLLHNCPEYWALYLAVARIGAVCVRLNFRLQVAELGYALDDAGCRLLVVHDELLDVANRAVEDSPVEEIVVLGDHEGSGVETRTRRLEDLRADDAALAVLGPAKGDAPVMIMYTSGTTGRAKGVVWTQQSTVMFGVIQLLQWGSDSSRIALTTGPLYHVGSMEDLLLPTLMCGGHAIMMRSRNFSLERALAVVEHKRVTDVLFFPAMLYELLERRLYERFDLSSLRTVITGGSPLHPRAVEQIAQVLPQVRLYPVYGLTEGGGISTVLSPEEVQAHPSAAGQPLPMAGVEIRTEAGQITDSGSVGEIWVSGPHVSDRYWGRPDDTEDAYRSGWVRTGDLGRLDGQRRLWVTGRLKDMIRTGDENVYAAEVESVITAIPGVYEAAVIGLPDDKYLEAVCAVVVRSEGAELTAEDVVAACREQLASYKKPRRVVFVDRLPRNPTGKVLKFKLKEELAGIDSRRTDG